jgi:hypothetical protein
MKCVVLLCRPQWLRALLLAAFAYYITVSFKPT